MSRIARRPPHPMALVAAALLLSSAPGPFGSPVAPAGAGARGPGWIVPSAAVAQEAGPVTLELKAEEGETSVYRFQSSTHITPPPGMGIETTADAFVIMSNAVEEVVGDTLRMSASIDSFSLELASDNEQMSSQLRQAEEQSRKRMKGETFEVAVTRRGEIVEMGSVGGGGVRQLDRSFRELAFATLPAEPVTVGESWTSRRTSGTSSFGIPVQGEVVTETTSTLSRIFRRGGSRVAEISVESTFAFEPDTAASSAMEVDMEGSSARTIHFDIEEGRFLSSSGAQDFTVHLSMAGQAGGSVTIQGSSESSSELVED